VDNETLELSTFGDCATHWTLSRDRITPSPSFDPPVRFSGI